MRKFMKIVLSILIVAVIAIVLWLGYRTFVNTIKMGKNSELSYFRYSSGGGMTGGHSEIVLTTCEDGSVLCTTSGSKYWYADAVSKEYYLDKSVMKDIKEVISDYHMERYENRFESKMVVLDGDTYSYTFTFDNGFSTRYCSTQSLPLNHGKAERKISEIISGYIQNGRKLPGLAEAKESDNEEETFEIEQMGSVYIKVFNYCQNKLYYRIYNKTQENIEYTEKIKILSATSGDLVYEYESQKKYPTSICQGGNSEQYVEIFDRLQAGKYIFVAESINCSYEFEIE